MRTKSHAHYHGALYFLLPLPPPLLTPDLFTALRFNQETRREDRRIFEPRYLSRIKSKDQQSLPFSLAISVYLKIHSYIYIYSYIRIGSLVFCFEHRLYFVCRHFQLKDQNVSLTSKFQSLTFSRIKKVKIYRKHRIWSCSRAKNTITNEFSLTNKPTLETWHNDNTV